MRVISHSVLLFVLLACAPAWATTYYIDFGSGVDQVDCGAGTGASACKTIDYAINDEADANDSAFASPGTHDFVVAAGTFTSGEVTTGGKPCSVEHLSTDDIVTWFNIVNLDCTRCSVYAASLPTTGDAALDAAIPWPISDDADMDVTLDSGGTFAINIDGSDNWTIRGFKFDGLRGTGVMDICDSTGTIIEGNYFPFTWDAKYSGVSDIVIDESPTTTIRHNRIELISVDTGTCGGGSYCTSGRLSDEGSTCTAGGGGCLPGVDCCNDGVFASEPCPGGVADCRHSCVDAGDCANECVTGPHNNRVLAVRGATTDDLTITHNYIPQYANGFRIGTEVKNHAATTDYIERVLINRNFFRKGNGHGNTLKTAVRYVLIENNVWTGDPDCDDCASGADTTCGDTCINNEMGTGSGYDGCYNQFRPVDFYDANNVVVRNNSFVNYGYAAYSPLLYGNYNSVGSAVGCSYSDADPGRCSGSPTTTCCDAGCASTPAACSGTCLGKCDHYFNAWYNNHVYDPSNIAEDSWIWFMGNVGPTQNFYEGGDFALDYNYINGPSTQAGNNVQYKCGGDEYTTWALWTDAGTDCEGGPPDQNSTYSTSEDVWVFESVASTWFVDLDVPETIANLVPTDSAPWIDQGDPGTNLTWTSACAGGDDTQCPGGTCSGTTCTIPYCATEDILGTQRIDGVCDPGAFEYEESTDVPSLAGIQFSGVTIN